MIVTIHQPEYLPWLGYFDRIIRSDLCVILDHVKYQKRGFINRNRIKAPYGWCWLTVSINPKMKSLPINQVEINSSTNWAREHCKLMKVYYSKAPFFKKYIEIFEEAVNRKWKYIADLDIYLFNKILHELGIKTKIRLSSKLNPSGKATDLNIDLCKKVNADTYLSGPGGEKYMDLDKFKKAGIKVIFQDFKHPVYSQLYNQVGFLPQLSIIDLLFNLGSDSLKAIKG